MTKPVVREESFVTKNAADLSAEPWGRWQPWQRLMAFIILLKLVYWDLQIGDPVSLRIREPACPGYG